MFNFFKQAFAVLCFLVLSGCCCSSSYYDAYRSPCTQSSSTCQSPPKSYKCVTLYMEQWDALAQYIADEVFSGLGQKRTLSVASSGITSFKKGFRELLITALTRRGISVADSDADHPVLEFDLLPFTGSRKNFFAGRGNAPIQIMVNLSILDRGQYIYRNSTVHTVPRGEIYDYIEDERLEQAPFKTYQLVAS